MGIKNFIDRLLNNHFEIIKSEVEECDYPIDYLYFADKYLGERNKRRGDFPKNDNYDDLLEQVKELKGKLENAGYEVRLDTQYGLKLTVSKIETKDYNNKEIMNKELSENVKNFKYLKKFNEGNHE